MSDYLEGMEPNICEECGARDVTLILASWYDDKLRCRDCYNTLWEQEQHRLRQDTKQNVETIQAIHERYGRKRGKQ